MMKCFTLFTFVLLLSTNLKSSQHISGSEADAKLTGTTELWYKEGAVIPSYIRFSEDFHMTESQLFLWLKENFSLPVGLKFILSHTNDGLTGLKHVVYNLSYNELPLSDQRVVVHVRNGQVHSFTGNLYPEMDVVNSIQIAEAAALNNALTAVNAQEYKWQLQAEEQWLKQVTQSESASFYPKSELVLVPALNGDHLELRKAYRFDIYAHKPASREYVYVDASNGQILKRNSLMKNADVIGTAETGYSGIRQISTSLVGGKYVLREYGRGLGVQTFNMQRTYQFSNAIDFRDGDNLWENKVNLDEFATDAHWGAEMTYDYFRIMFNRSSFDGNGAALYGFVHWGEGEARAMWDGYRVLFGDGASATLPYTTIDITAHEFTHGLIDHTANFVYQDESGALCESFADIFGNCVEYFGKPNEFSWRIGDDRGAYISDMSNPNFTQNPDTYHGIHWYSGTDDNGGVHTNSGVHNYWFYLVSEGGNGINDLNQLYDVNGIGMNNAAIIAYENLTGYLTPTSDFEEAREFSILIARDMFGICSPQHVAVVNAWHAVGMGDKMIPEAKADFSSDRQRYCNPPFTVKFENQSNYDFNFIWDFGDGTTDDKNINPVHNYAKPGKYTVKLTIDGGECGTDEQVRYDFIDGTLVEKPIGRSATTYEGESVQLTASSTTGDINWYADLEGNQLVATGNNFLTPPLYQNTTYYVKSVVPGTSYETGRRLEDILVNGSYSGQDQGLIFDVYQDIVIKTVRVNSNVGGSHRIQIRNADQVVVYETNLLLEPGPQEIVLNAEVMAGLDYNLTLTGVGGNLWVSRSADFPYNIAGVVSIKRSNGTFPTDYPYFFDWKVKEVDCESDFQEINVSVNYIGASKLLFNEIYSKNEMSHGIFQYYIKLDVPQGTSVEYGLYNISGQKMLEYTDNEVRIREETNLNSLLNLDNFTGGVYFISVKGQGLDKSKRIILQSGGR